MGHCSLFKNLSVQGLNLELVAGADCRAFKALEMQGIASRNVFAECSIFHLQLILTRHQICKSQAC